MGLLCKTGLGSWVSGLRSQVLILAHSSQPAARSSTSRPRAPWLCTRDIFCGQWMRRRRRRRRFRRPARRQRDSRGSLPTCRSRSRSRRSGSSGATCRLQWSYALPCFQLTPTAFVGFPGLNFAQPDGRGPFDCAQGWLPVAPRAWSGTGLRPSAPATFSHRSQTASRPCRRSGELYRACRRRSCR